MRKVQAGGRVDFRGRRLRVPQAFTGQRVALRPLDEDGRWAVYFTSERIAIVDLTRIGKV